MNEDSSDFDLNKREFLFNAEGFNLFSANYFKIKGKDAVKDISMNKLHQAVQQALNRKNTTPL